MRLRQEAHHACILARHAPDAAPDLALQVTQLGNLKTIDSSMTPRSMLPGEYQAICVDAHVHRRGILFAIICGPLNKHDRRTALRQTNPASASFPGLESINHPQESDADS